MHGNMHITVPFRTISRSTSFTKKPETIKIDSHKKITHNIVL